MAGKRFSSMVYLVLEGVAPRNSAACELVSNVSEIIFFALCQYGSIFFLISRSSGQPHRQ